MKGRLMNLLFPRIPIWDPDRFLTTWMPVMRPILSWAGALVWLAVVIWAVATVAPMWSELKASAADAINPSNWLWLWAVFVFIKFVHEMGHAFACRRFGGEVHELGIMFLVFIPTPYVDASSAWLFPSRWKRLFVGAAGMIFEIFVAALAAFVWANTGSGDSQWALVHQLSYNIMLIASVSTVLFNANPLLRYDGYYMLSDILEIPNLQMKSTQYTMGLIKRHIFRVKQHQPLPAVGQRWQLFLYAITSTPYRIAIGLAIILLVTFQIPLVGVLMGISGVALWVLVPLFKGLKYLLLEPELHRKRLRACGITAAFFALLFGGLGLIPVWFNVRAEGTVEARNREVIYAGESGTVAEIHFKDGQIVSKGQPLFTLRNEELDYRVVRAEAELEATRIRVLKSGAADPAQREIDEYDLNKKRESLRMLQAQQAELIVRAPFDGIVTAPLVEERAEAYVKQGEELAIVATLDELEIRAVVPQTEIGVLPSQIPQAQVRLAGDVGRRLDSERVVLIDVGQDRIPHPSLGVNAGGTVPIDPSDRSGTRAAINQFELRVRLPNDGQRYYPGQRAYVLVELEPRPLLSQWVRRLLQVIQTHAATSAW